MFYSNSNSTNTRQASVHEREQSVVEIAGPRFNVVLNAVNNVSAFSPPEASSSTTEHAQETVSRQGNINATIAGEVVMSSEVSNYGQNDPVSSNPSVDQTITYTNLNVDNQNLKKARHEVISHASSSAELNVMFEDPAIKELI